MNIEIDEKTLDGMLAELGSMSPAEIRAKLHSYDSASMGEALGLSSLNLLMQSEIIENWGCFELPEFVAGLDYDVVHFESNAWIDMESANDDEFPLAA